MLLNHKRVKSYDDIKNDDTVSFGGYGKARKGEQAKQRPELVLGLRFRFTIADLRIA
jgi:hypothetical protein